MLPVEQTMELVIMTLTFTNAISVANDITNQDKVELLVLTN